MEEPMANPKFAKKETAASEQEDAPEVKKFAKVSTGGAKPKAAPAAAEGEEAGEKRTKRSSAASDPRKLKVMVKESPYREGSKRDLAFQALAGAKTVAEYMTTENAKAKYLTRWEAAGIIQIG